MRRHLQRLLLLLPERGFDLYVAAPEEDREVWKNVLDSEKFFPTPIPDRPHPAKDYQAVQTLSRVIETVRPDCLHAHGYRSAWISSWASRLSSERRRDAGGSGAFTPPFLATAHNLFPERPSILAGLAFQLSQKRVNRWIAITRAVSRSLTEAGVEESRVTVIPNGIDARSLRHSRRADARTPLGIDPSAPLVAVVARLEPRKGVEDALRAFAMFRRAHPEANLVIAGEGPERDSLIDLTRRLSLEKSVRFLGWSEDAASTLASSDACLIPSRSEGQSLVALEAMALGVPVVASATGGLPEMIRDGETGLLAPPRNPPEMARALDRLFKNDLLRERLARAALREVRDHWDEEKMIRRTGEIYASLVDESARENFGRSNARSESVR
jgi:glycosyltransferase involved in cell wall biosynthesis